MAHPSRRLVLQAASLAAASRAAAAAKKPPVVDCHIHCFDGKDSTRFPYHARAPYRPPERASPEDLLACMDAAGVDFGVIVHPEPYQDDHRYLEHCLAVGKGRLKGTCLFFADRPWKQELPALVKRAGGGVVALRVHAYAPDRLPPFGGPELRALWKAATDLGLAIQVHLEPRYARPLEPLIQEFTSTPVIIDHLGRPFQGTPDEHAVVLRWSRFPHTIMKLSAVPPPEQYPHRDVRPVIAALVSAFGPSRMISGGGFSNAESKPDTYRKAQEKLRSFVAHLPAAQQQAIFGGNAARIFRFAA